MNKGEVLWRGSRTEGTTGEFVCVSVFGGRGESAEVIIDRSLFTSHFSMIAVKAKVSV